MASLFDALAAQSTANPDDPTGAYLGNLIDPRTAGQFQAARNQSGDLGFWQGMLQASAPHLGVSGTSPAAAGMLGMMQAQNLLPQQALQSAQTGNAAADNMYKRLQAVQLGNQIQNDPAFFNMMKMIAQRYAQQQGGGGSEQGSPMVQPGAASQTGTTSPTGMPTQAGMSSPGSTQNSDTNSGSPTYADKVIHWESGGDPNIVSQRSSATGLGQFLDGTWLNLYKKTNPDNGMSDSQILALRTNPDISRAMINTYGQENAGILAKAGVPINDATLYGAHWFGPAGAAKIFSARQDTPLASLGFSPKVLALNNLTGGTAGDFANIVSRKMGAGVLTLPGLANAQTAQGSGSSQAPSGAVNAAPAGIPAGLAGAAPAGNAAPSAPVQLAQAGGNPYAGLPLSPAEALQLEVLAGAAGRTNMIPDAFKGIATLPTERAKGAIQKELELQYNPAIAGATTGATKKAEAPYNTVDIYAADPTNRSQMKLQKVPQDIFKQGEQAINNYLYGGGASQAAPLPEVPNYSGGMGTAPQMGATPQVPMVPSMPAPSMGPVPQPGQNPTNMIGGRPTLAPPGTRMPPPGGVPIGTPGAGPVIGPAQAAQMNANAGHASLPVMPTSSIFGPGMAPPPGAGSVSQPAPMVPMVPSRPPQAPQMPAGAGNPTQAPITAPGPTPTQAAPGAGGAIPPASGGMGQFGKPEVMPVNPLYQKAVEGHIGEDNTYMAKTIIPEADKARDMIDTATLIKQLLPNVTTGWRADTLASGAKIMSALGVPDAEIQDWLHTDPTATDLLSKKFLEQSSTAVRAMGAREPGSVISLFGKAYPGLTTQKNAIELMENVLFMQAKWSQDRLTAAQTWRAQQTESVRTGGPYSPLAEFNAQFQNGPQSGQIYLKAAEAMTGGTVNAWKGLDKEQQRAVYAAIPSGTNFVGPDGKPAVKP